MGYTTVVGQSKERKIVLMDFYSKRSNYREIVLGIFLEKNYVDLSTHILLMV